MVFTYSRLVDAKQDGFLKLESIVG